jgi:hypothetical protein
VSIKAEKAIILGYKVTETILKFLKQHRSEIELWEVAQPRIEYPYPDGLSKRELLDCIIELDIALR